MNIENSVKIDTFIPNFKMRSPVFRAWDEENKKMIYNVSIINNLGHVVKNKSFDFGTMTGEYTILPINADKIMQYIGLKDCNNIEIFIGDILKHSMQGDVQFYPYVVQDMNDLYVCLNNNDNYLRIQKNSLEIIGNIYETPNLLELNK